MTPPLTIVVVDDDLLFSTRITSALIALGHRPLPAASLAAFRKALSGGPDAVIFNLASLRLDAVEAIREAKAAASTRGIPLLGFCGHADTARQAAARAAGCDLVATNGEVASHLERLLTALLPIPRSPASGR